MDSIVARSRLPVACQLLLREFVLLRCDERGDSPHGDPLLKRPRGSGALITLPRGRERRAPHHGSAGADDVQAPRPKTVMRYDHGRENQDQSAINFLGYDGE